MNNTSNGKYLKYFIFKISLKILYLRIQDKNKLQDANRGLLAVEGERVRSGSMGKGEKD